MVQPLDYHDPLGAPSPTRRIRTANSLGWIAIIASLSPLFHMLIRTRPFWTGHPLAPIGRAVNGVSQIDTLGLAAVLGTIAIAMGRDGRRWPAGAWLGLAAVLIVCAWLVLLAIVLLMLRSWESQ